jgi:hypothetical protein
LVDVFEIFGTTAGGPIDYFHDDFVLLNGTMTKKINIPCDPGFLIEK